MNRLYLKLGSFSALIGLVGIACTLERGGMGPLEMDGSGGSTALPDGGGAGAGVSGSGGNTTSPAGGSSGSGGSGGITSGGLGGAAGNHSVENCTDGVDNDDNGLVDCADPACSDYQCVDFAPPGWVGYSYLNDRDYSKDPSASNCKNGAPPKHYFYGVQAGECEPCACGPLTGVVCGDRPIFCAKSADCNGLTNITDILNPSGGPTCVNWSDANPASCRLEPAPAVEPGTCVASGGQQLKAPFENMLEVCELSVSGVSVCETGACIPEELPEYSEQICVHQDGEHQCPDSWPERFVAHLNFIDNRDCGECACEASPTCQGGKYHVYDDNGCSQSGRDITSNSCDNLGGVTGPTDWGSWSLRRTEEPTPQAGCNVKSGSLAGEVQTLNTRTFCCRSQAGE